MKIYGEPWILRRTPKTWQIDWRHDEAAYLMADAPRLKRENADLRAMIERLKNELTKALVAYLKATEGNPRHE